eukprot:NODE_6551_length_559_cov_20.527451_g6134_i0.p1 GENE.NODE_6551_length_559_cov_20.527451_g6134_i0~~NODE_6551_length_559_cov_20.527451_g6134_i0.p1  ORF type:complete len:110 (-),score=2.16 NODE_6551_length_559_cov_20.527451_g6134_i0:97-426(-)
MRLGDGWMKMKFRMHASRPPTELYCATLPSELRCLQCNEPGRAGKSLELIALLCMIPGLPKLVSLFILLVLYVWPLFAACGLGTSFHGCPSGFHAFTRSLQGSAFGQIK